MIPLLYTLPIALLSFIFCAVFLPATVAATVLIQSFAEIYEPSAVIQIGPDTVLIAEDDGKKPLIRASIVQKKDGFTLLPDRLPKLSIAVNDLEGATMGKDGQIFLITSHTAKKGGKYRPARQRLLQITLKGNTIVALTHTDTLLKYIKQHLKKFYAFKTSELETINIESIAFDPLQQNLLLGLRTPLHNARSIVLSLKDPYGLTKSRQPVFADTIISLDMQGSGIRAMEYDKNLGLYLLAGEVKNKKGKFRPRLWVWDGRPDHQPSRVRLPKIKGIKNIEGITPVHFNGSNYLLLVCDDGKKKKTKGAHYIIINSSDIVIKE